MLTRFPPKSSFSAGLNRLADPVTLGDTEYALLVNGRTRFGGITPTTLPKEITTLLQSAGSKFQGLYTADTFQLAFVSGRAFIRNYASPTSNFNLIDGLFLDTNVDFIYAVLVPASTVNFKRIQPLTTDAIPVINRYNPIQLADTISGTPACVVVQDGINQPFLIFPDGTARVASTFAQWDKDANREYVPIGKQMFFDGEILYVVCQNSDTRRYTTIKRSVTGRPLDFVIAIDYLGDKPATESIANVDYSVDFAEITCIGALSLLDKKGFYVSTLKNSYSVILNEDVRVFGEPTLSNVGLFNTGALNQFSITNLLGDVALIDSAGIRSFNAVEQLKFRGQNAPFSTKVQPFFGSADMPILQGTTAAITFDNYAFFAVKTIHGNAILVYDTLLQSWTSIDIYTNLTGAIKQFASVDTLNLKALFFITDDNKMYQMFGQTTIAECGVYLCDFSPEGDNKEQKPVSLNLVFSSVLESGTISASCFLDSQQQNTLVQPISQASAPVESIVSLPFGSANEDTMRNVSFDFSTVSSGWRVGFYVTWDFAASLTEMRYKGDVTEKKNSMKETARDFTRLQDSLK